MRGDVNGTRFENCSEKGVLDYGWRISESHPVLSAKAPSFCTAEQYDNPMPLQFTAFGVRKGNAFLLRRTELGPRRARVLVDGGENVNELSTYLSATFWPNQIPPTRSIARKDWAKIDVVVLSHTDSDHIGGLLQVFNLPLTVDELWLPNRWAKWIIGLVTSPLGTLFDVEKKIKATSPEQYHKAVTEALARLRPQETWDTTGLIRPSEEVQTTSSTNHSLWRRLGTEVLHVLADSWSKEAQPDTGQGDTLEVPSEELRKHCEAAALLEDYFAVDVEFWSDTVAWHCDEIVPTIPEWQDDPYRWRSKIHMATINSAAKRIYDVRSLAVSAYKAGAEIHWYAFDAQVHQSSADLYVVNGSRLTHIPARRDPNDYMFFTKDPSPMNAESLVVCAVGQEGEGNVLFTADSDFKFAEASASTLPWTQVMLITAPHHGAKTNRGLSELYRDAFKAKQVSTSVWVRSDEHYQRNPRPDQWYTALSSSVGVTRYCTSCSKPFKTLNTHQHVVLEFHHSSWKLQAGSTVTPCSC